MQLKGIASATKRLADGRRVKYWYAWRGGPRLEGEPGTPEFIASYNAAIAARRKPAQTHESLQTLLNAYQDSADFRKLAERTQRDYTGKIKLISRRFGTMKLGVLASRRVRADFLGWRDELAERSLRQADYALTILAAVLAFGVDRGLITTNHCARVKNFMTATALTASGRMRTKRRSWTMQPRNFICRS